MEEPFKEGDKVICLGRGGVNWLREGSMYTVVAYEAQYEATNFTWPAYLTVINDEGKAATYHAHRFRKVEHD